MSLFLLKLGWMNQLVNMLLFLLTSVFTLIGLGGRLIEAASLVSDIMESCSFQVTYNNIVFTVLRVYRPAAESVRHFVDHIDSLLHDEFSNCESMYFAGDFNIDLINVDCNAVEYLMNSLRQLHFVQTITKPTRFPPNDCGDSQRLYIFTHHLFIICISFINCLLSKIAYFNHFRGSNCNFCIKYKAYIFLISHIQNHGSTRKRIFSHFRFIPAHMAISPVRQHFENHFIPCCVRVKSVKCLII